MKLIELNPKLGRGAIISFDCPLCHTHRCRINSNWKTRGNFEDLRILPATIISTCGYMFTIQNGLIQELERRVHDERLIAK